MFYGLKYSIALRLDNSIMAHTGSYYRILNLIQKWPIDQTKIGR